MDFVHCAYSACWDPLYAALLAAFFAAKEKISIVTPYFIPNEMLLEALVLAAKRGVHVKVIVPEKSNHRLADMVRKSYLDQLQQSGVKVYQYRPGMVHAKLVTLDGEIAIAGSANMDLRSLFLNYEIGLRVRSPETVNQLDEWIEVLIKGSQIGVARSNPIMEVIEGTARLLSPLL